MSEINATMGVAQMQRLDDLIAARQHVANLYTSRLLAISDLILPSTEASETMSWFVYVVRLAAGYTRDERDRVIQGLRMHDIGASDYFPCIHLQPIYHQAFGFRPGDFLIAESVSQRTIALPFYPGLTDREVDLVGQTLELMITLEGLNARR